MGNACCADDANRNDAQNNFKAANGVEDSTFKQNKKRGAMHGVDMDDNLTQGNSKFSNSNRKKL